MKNYYEILEVDIDSTDEEIKENYKKLIRKYHPDISDHPDAEKMTILINQAYDSISTKRKRDVYNQQIEVDYDDVQNEVYVTDEDSYIYTSCTTRRVASISMIVSSLILWTSIMSFSIFSNWSNLIDINISFNFYEADWISVVGISLWIFLIGYLVFSFTSSLLWFTVLAASLITLYSINQPSDFIILTIAIPYLMFIITNAIWEYTEEDWNGWASLIFFTAFIFRDFVFANSLLCISAIFIAFTILSIIFIYLDMMDNYNNEWIEWRHIIIATILLPILGGLIMGLAYVIENYV